MLGFYLQGEALSLTAKSYNSMNISWGSSWAPLPKVMHLIFNNFYSNKHSTPGSVHRAEKAKADNAGPALSGRSTPCTQTELSALGAVISVMSRHRGKWKQGRLTLARGDQGRLMRQEQDLGGRIRLHQGKNKRQGISGRWNKL